MALVWDQYCFKNTDLQTEKVSSKVSENEETAEENKNLYCKFCKNYITALSAAIAINGEHTHTFSNPAGYTYIINCFQSAPGCLIVGDRTDEYTWFSDHQWQLTVCHSCKEQLGWLFSNDQQFYALIADRLRLE